jgi:hypothetical protein
VGTLKHNTNGSGKSSKVIGDEYLVSLSACIQTPIPAKNSKTMNFVIISSVSSKTVNFACVPPKAQKALVPPTYSFLNLNSATDIQGGQEVCDSICRIASLRFYLDASKIVLVCSL